MSEGAGDGQADRAHGAERLVDADGVQPTGGDAGSGVGGAAEARRVWKAYVGENVRLGIPLLVTAVPGEVVEFGDRQLVRQIQFGANDRFEAFDRRWHDTPEAAKASVADMVEAIGMDLVRQAAGLRAGRG